jgi:peptidoglycan/xylan/chitin deacetylase (PgdA/CDA1 family)
MKATPPRLIANHALSKVLHAYADWRIGATDAEKHCYKTADSVLLTFDDYGTTQEVDDILAVLAQHGVKAMFFLQGDWAEKQPELVKRIAKAGHVVGNHTYSHAVLLPLDNQAAAAEITRGVKSTWLRPPQGRYNKRIRRLASELGYRICYWTIDSRDWTGATVETMRHTILTELRPGAVILFHLHGAHTRELLPQLIPEIKARGLTLTTHDEAW